MTPRQELVKMSAIRLRILRRDNPTLIHLRVAIEQIVDECRACLNETLGQKIREYYIGITDNAEKKLWVEVLRGAK